ncbi:MAG TPA: DUF4386 domain-containing protein [Thermoanaerobaculia bacterium]
MTELRYARFAGFLYIFLIAVYLLPMFIIRALQVPGNFTATAQRVMNAETVYRIALSLDLVAGLSTVLLAMSLYVALKPVDRHLALMALVFRLIEAMMVPVAVMFGFGVLKLYSGVPAFNAEQLSGFLSLRSAMGTAGVNISAIFFGAGSILYFYLFRKTNYLPAILSMTGFIGSLLVPLICFGALIAPKYAGILQFGWIPIAIAEIGGGAWLMFGTARQQQPAYAL